MKLRTFGLLTAIGAAMLIGLSAPSAQAAYVVYLTQQGSDVVATGSGTLDLTDLGFYRSFVVSADIDPNEPAIVTGPTTPEALIFYTGVTGPGFFGSRGSTSASNGSGDLVEIIGAFGAQLGVSEGYVSGSSLSDSSTYKNSTFSSLGVTPGIYKWTWGSGAHADSFTLVIQPCNIECYNVFIGPLSQPATSFTIKLAGNVASEVNAAATANDPLVNPFAYVNQNFFGGSGSSSVTASFDGTNTEITYTGTYPILPSYTYSYGPNPHFGFEGVDPPILSQYWTYSDGSLTRPALGISCTPGGSNFLVFFAEVTAAGQTVGEWNECQGGGITLTNSTNGSVVLSDVGYYLSTTGIPLDSLNFAAFPPPDQAGTQFTGLPSFDGSTLVPGRSVNVSLAIPGAQPAPPSGTACNGVYSGTFSGNVTVSAGQNCTFISGGQITGNVNVTGGAFVLGGAKVGGNLTITAGTFTLGTATIGGTFQIQGLPSGGASNSVCGTTVGGNMAFDSNAAAVQIGSSEPLACPGNTIRGNLNVVGNTGSALMFDNSVGGNMSVLNNTGPTNVVGNSVRGNLLCQGNTNLTMGGGNTAGGHITGQCN